MASKILKFLTGLGWREILTILAFIFMISAGVVVYNLKSKLLEAELLLSEANARVNMLQSQVSTLRNQLNNTVKAMDELNARNLRELEKWDAIRSGLGSIPQGTPDETFDHLNRLNNDALRLLERSSRISGN